MRSSDREWDWWKNWLGFWEEFSWAMFWVARRPVHLSSPPSSITFVLNDASVGAAHRITRMESTWPEPVVVGVGVLRTGETSTCWSCTLCKQMRWSDRRGVWAADGSRAVCIHGDHCPQPPPLTISNDSPAAPRNEFVLASGQSCEITF